MSGVPASESMACDYSRVSFCMTFITTISFDASSAVINDWLHVISCFTSKVLPLLWYVVWSPSCIKWSLCINGRFYNVRCFDSWYAFTPALSSLRLHCLQTDVVTAAMSLLLLLYSVILPRLILPLLSLILQQMLRLYRGNSGISVERPLNGLDAIVSYLNGCPSFSMVNVSTRFDSFINYIYSLSRYAQRHATWTFVARVC